MDGWCGNVPPDQARAWPRRSVNRPRGGPCELPVSPCRCILAVMSQSAVPRRHLPTSPFKAPVIPPCPQFAEGDRVVHDAYGLGRVTRVEGTAAVLVDFGSRQERIPSPFEGMSHL
ncbi:hypothetical protein Franean1_4212 [Parafrankia sp. EAN1pec]|nr:hypothetical protein Franean1_4212 [Frankia sp. EAN1pec]